MIHGYIHDKEVGDSLLKIDIDTEDSLTGFNYNKENDILCLYNKTQNRFLVYSNIESLELKNSYTVISSNYGEISKILARRSYMQSNSEYTRINFVYYVLTTNKQLLKFNIYYYTSSERFEMRVINMTTSDFNFVSPKDFSCVVLEKTDDYNMILHDPAFILFDNNKNILYCSSASADEIIYTHQLDSSDPDLDNDFVLVEPNDSLNKSFLTSYPIATVGEKVILIYVNFERDIISRKISFDNPIVNKLSKIVVELNGYNLTISGIDSVSNEIRSYTIDITNTEKKTVEKENVTNKHDLSLNLFFNGGNYIRQNSDKIKVAIKSYNPSLQYPNKTQTILKQLESVESNPIISIDGEDIEIPRIFDSNSEIKEFMKEDITALDTKKQTEKNKIIKSIIKEPRIIGLFNSLNNLDVENKDFEPIFKEGFSHVKFIKLKNDTISKTLYSLLYKSDGTFESGGTIIENYGSIVLTDGRYFGETNADFLVVQLSSKINDKENLTEPVFIRKQSDFYPGSGSIKNINLNDYNRNISIKEKEEIEDRNITKNIIRKYATEI